MKSAVQNAGSNATLRVCRPALFIGMALLAGLTLAAPSRAAAPENDPIKDAIRKMFDIAYVPVQSPIIAKIFSASFYDVTSKIKGGDMASKLRVARIGDRVVLLEDTTTTHPMPVFLSTIKKDFRITKDEDAALFENTLDRLFPVGGFGGDDSKHKEIRRTKESVTFVRGAFFDKRKGFILTLAADGSVTGVTYSLDIKK